MELGFVVGSSGAVLGRGSKYVSCPDPLVSSGSVNVGGSPRIHDPLVKNNAII